MFKKKQTKQKKNKSYAATFVLARALQISGTTQRQSLLKIKQTHLVCTRKLSRKSFFKMLLLFKLEKMQKR